METSTKNDKTKFVLFSLITVFFALAIVATVIFIIYLNRQKYIIFNNNQNANITVSETPKKIVINTNFYLVPVTGFKEKRNNITLDELKTTNIVVMQSDATAMRNHFADLKYTILEDSQFVDTIANGNQIGLVSWDKLSPRMKSLSINNIYFFDKTIDLSNYPLRFSDEISEENLDKVNVFDQTKLNRILTMGEIIPSRTVDKVMRTKNDYLWPFREVKTFMDKYDARVATFESPMLGNGNGTSCGAGCMTFVANEKFLDGMKYSGINLVSLADNHSMNAGITGIGNTINLLNSAGIKTVGAATTNNEDATAPQILDIGGIKYGFLAYNDIPSANDWATDSSGGTGRIDDNNYNILPGRVEHDVQRAKDAGAQYIIALMHWGAREYTNDPMPHQKELAHHLIDSGVDLIIGDHPHWVMSVEFYTPKAGGETKFIYYGIGNYIFDQSWSTETSQGSFAELNFYGSKLLSIHIYPHQIYEMSQPRLVPEGSKEYNAVLDRIWQFTGRI